MYIVPGMLEPEHRDPKFAPTVLQIIWALIPNIRVSWWRERVRKHPFWYPCGARDNSVSERRRWGYIHQESLGGGGGGLRRQTSKQGVDKFFFFVRVSIGRSMDRARPFSFLPSFLSLFVCFSTFKLPLRLVLYYSLLSFVCLFVCLSVCSLWGGRGGNKENKKYRL